tara:strand:- start:1461 stop:2534 length:1074 start_codon:yes stop_codon:yes gene_type:complete
MTIVFTRYLYSVDEVTLTFMECLLKQQDIEECYYWFYEYYKSGYEEKSFELLWKIYYDYYYIKNPKMEEKITNKYLKWKATKNIKCVLWVVKNLFRLNKCHTILLLRTYYNNRNTDILDDNEENDTIKYENKEEILFVKAIKQKKKIAIAYYLNRIKDDRKLELVNKSLTEQIQYNDNYSDKYHYLLSKTIKSLKITPKKKVYYKMLLNKEVTNILQTDESCKNDSKEVSYSYKTLSKRRMYGISKNIGCFSLSRQNKDINHIFWYHWEFYAYKSPLWKSRFDKYDIKINKKKQTIDFKDDDEYEEFYEEYGYEPDEQSDDVQGKSICKMENLTIKMWINSVFNKKLKNNIRVKIDY